MVFQREELLEKYIRLREEMVDPYVPDLDFTNDEIRYVKFNDAWVGTNPFRRFLLPRLSNRKNTFPKKGSGKIPKNANPENYVRLHYYCDGKLKMADLGRYKDRYMGTVYVSNRLSIEYFWREYPDRTPSYTPICFEWCEYDDMGRIISAEEFEFRGDVRDDVKINCEYYEYDGDVLSHAWRFDDFEKFPMPMHGLISTMMPDRIYNPEQKEYIFRRCADGLDVIYNHFYRKSQTITDEWHVSEETLTHLAENGFRLV